MRGAAVRTVCCPCRRRRRPVTLQGAATLHHLSAMRVRTRTRCCLAPPQELGEFLRGDLPHLFDDQGIDASKYDEAVEFVDPITYYNNIKGIATELVADCLEDEFEFLGQPWLAGWWGCARRRARSPRRPALLLHRHQPRPLVRCAAALPRAGPHAVQHCSQPSLAAHTPCLQPTNPKRERDPPTPSPFHLQAICSTLPSSSACSSPRLCCTTCGAQAPWS